MPKSSLLYALLLAFSLPSLSACERVNSSPTETLKMQADNTIPDHITLKIGEDGVDFVNRTRHFLNQDLQPAGLNFYEIHADYQEKRMTVRLEHGKHSLEIPYVLGSMSTEDRELAEQGIQPLGIKEISLSTNVNDRLKEGYGSHNQAYLYVQSLLAKFKAAGWKRYIPPNHARVRGEKAFKYYQEVDDLLGLDPDYPLTLTEWMALSARQSIYTFYADNVYAEIGFMRSEPKAKDAEGNEYFSGNPSIIGLFQPGAAYLLTVKFKSAEAVNLYGTNKEEDRPRWRALWLEQALKDRKDRNEAEKAAIEAGYEIDTRYQDPPLPPAPPGQTNPVLPKELTFMPATHLYSLNPNAVALGKRCKTGDICPESGVWHFFGPAITRDDMYAFLPSDAQKREFKAGDIFPTVSMGYKTRNPIKKWIKGDIYHVDAAAHWVLKAYT